MDSSVFVPAALVAGPAQHAARGGGATLAVLALLANAMRNRGALAHLLLLRFRRAAAAVSIAPPSRGVFAVAVFVAVYRFVHRLEQRLEKHRQRPQAAARDSTQPTDSPAASGEREAAARRSRRAALVASALGVLCVAPESRAPIISLVATNSASLAFRAWLEKRPELAHLAPLELLAFMWSGGWIMYSAFFHPESYDPAHMKLIMRYTLVSPAGAARLQAQYRAGGNPSTCELRHPGRACAEYLFPGFLARVVALGYRVYLPVHATAWLLALARGRAPAPARVAAGLSRSAAYLSGFVGLGWAASCATGALGDRSPAWRKLQFALCGSLPALAILCEAPARRRPIGVILVSYALVSCAAVASRRLPPRARAGPLRALLDAALCAAGVAYALPALLRANALLRRVLLGASSARAGAGASGVHGGGSGGVCVGVGGDDGDHNGSTRTIAAAGSRDGGAGPKEPSRADASSR